MTRNSSQIRQALEDAVAWSNVSRADLLSRQEQQLRSEDLNKAKAILQHWREQERAEAVGTND